MSKLIVFLGIILIIVGAIVYIFAQTTPMIISLILTIIGIAIIVFYKPNNKTKLNNLKKRKKK